jgi:IS30 family transposase
MRESYHHLDHDQRCQIYILKERGDPISTIAQQLGAHRSTIYRELNGNTEQGGYDYKQADENARQRRENANRAKRKMTPEMILIIEENLKLQWSPEQISGRLHRLDHKTAVSYETIYQHIWKDKRNGGILYKELRHSGKKYNKRGKGNAGRGCIPHRVDIDERPPIVEEKTRLGDWELDTIIGAGQSGIIVSMVERTSKLTKLKKVSHRTAPQVGHALIDCLGPVREFVHTLTSDNGKEFANHEIVSQSLNAKFYFAKPYHSWERGLNEHTNGLIRQYFPKSKSFAEISADDIKRVEERLNHRPRKVLSYLTPSEVFKKLGRESRLRNSRPP